MDKYPKFILPKLKYVNMHQIFHNSLHKFSLDVFLLNWVAIIVKIGPKPHLYIYINIPMWNCMCEENKDHKTVSFVVIYNWLNNTFMVILPKFLGNQYIMWSKYHCQKWQLVKMWWRCMFGNYKASMWLF